MNEREQRVRTIVENLRRELLYAYGDGNFSYIVCGNSEVLAAYIKNAGRVEDKDLNKIKLEVGE